jgi:hypothetical protein
MKTRSDGLTVLSLYHFFAGLMSLLAMCGILTIPATMGIASIASAQNDPNAAAITGIIGLFGLICSCLFVLLVVANVVVGWGLWTLRPWARTAALVLAVVSLFNFPVGTGIGALSIWYLLRDDVKAEFVESTGTELVPTDG